MPAFLSRSKYTPPPLPLLFLFRSCLFLINHLPLHCLVVELCAVGYITGTYQSHGLADFPFEWFFNWITGQEFSRVVIGVQERVEYNYFNDWDCYIVKCLEYDTVQKILSCYKELGKRGAVPEYVPGSTTAQATIAGVAKCSGESEQLVGWCLYELYFGVEDGSISGGGNVLHPRTTDPVDQSANQGPFDVGVSAVSEVLNILKWVAIIGVVGVVAFYGYQIYQGYGSYSQYKGVTE